jgi:hypothetical protein
MARAPIRVGAVLYSQPTCNRHPQIIHNIRSKRTHIDLWRMAGSKILELRGAI